MSWRVYFRNCWSNGIFTHKCFLGFYREVWKNENIQCYSVSTEQQFFVDSRGQRRIARLIKAEANSNSDNFIQPKYAEGHLWMHNTLPLKQRGNNTTRTHWVPLVATKNWKLRLQFTKIGKILHDLMNPGFCCGTQMVRSKFGINHISTWIPPAFVTLYGP